MSFPPKATRRDRAATEAWPQKGAKGAKRFRLVCASSRLIAADDNLFTGREQVGLLGCSPLVDRREVIWIHRDDEVDVAEFVILALSRLQVSDLADS